MSVSVGKIAKYAILPGFWPRLKELFGSGFGYIAYLLAVIYNALRLLPANHPYLNPANMGRFGIRHVVAEAGRNLVFDRRNIDQVVLFFATLAGIVLLFLQFALLIISLLPGSAEAAGISGLAPFADWFATPSNNMPYGPAQDIVFIVLDRVFGMEGIFNSCIAQGIPCENLRGEAHQGAVPDYPYPIHIALHRMLEFYSYGIAIVAVIIILYFIVVLVTETIMTGSPFGQRANQAWMPVRLILFFALLAPLGLGGGPNAGINGAQYITFMAAKWGSNFASNGWGHFNETLTDSYLGNVDDLIAKPNIPELSTLIQFFYLAKMCQIGEKINNNNDIQPYIVRSKITAANTLSFASADFKAAREFAENGNVIVRFGVEDTKKFGLEKGHVKPFCGEVQMEIGDAHEPGAQGIAASYFALMQNLWKDPDIAQYAQCSMARVLPVSAGPDCGDLPAVEFARAMNEKYSGYVRKAVATNIDEQVNAGDWAVPPELLKKGWGGAAIWYNRIAQMNGAVTTAIFNLPRATLYPAVMEETAKQHQAKDESTPDLDRFDPMLSDQDMAKYARRGDEYLATALFGGHRFWNEDGVSDTPKTQSTGNGFLDFINAVYGTSGLFSMRENADIHPLAQLSAIGKGLIEATVRNTLIAVAGSFAAGIMGPLKDAIGGLSALMQSTVVVTLVIGVMLYFVLPLMPFMYFLFAIGTWVKAIFEAIVAMPLWALAHITRIDGEGLPGPAASNGYFLILEIFLRPILTVFGLLGSISIFSALVMVMNEVFDLVVANMTGFDTQNELQNIGPTQVAYYRGALDEFFFTLVYVALAYITGTACFKLIDQIPNQILRWLGTTVTALGGDNEAGVQQVSQSIYQGTTLTVNQIAGGMNQISGGRLLALTQK